MLLLATEPELTLLHQILLVLATAHPLFNKVCLRFNVGYFQFVDSIFSYSILTPKTPHMSDSEVAEVSAVVAVAAVVVAVVVVAVAVVVVVAEGN